MRDRTRKAIVWLVAAIAVLYALDFVAWHVRQAAGSGTGSVTVDQFIATPLKGNREGYDYAGPVDMPCARAVFPHGGMQACWWLEHHRTQWE